MNGTRTEAEAAVAAKLRAEVPKWLGHRRRAASAEKRVIGLVRKLADARGVSFIRFEQIEAEFGKGKASE